MYGCAFDCWIHANGIRRMGVLLTWIHANGIPHMGVLMTAGFMLMEYDIWVCF